MLSFCLGSLRSRKRLVGNSALAFLAIGLLYVVLWPRSYTASSEFLVYIEEIRTAPIWRSCLAVAIFLSF